ncbi:hypothetical protein [Couchioplanes caeruleus]|uniref:hypothetical protein n=1 Tax=Couchioplanes caeruleus TaxID=56438 RepID=UPI001FD34830|nr:hypothetical protein [Couchioplanes caeruleus]
MTDLFGVAGRRWLTAAPLDTAYRLRVNALLRLIDAIHFEIRAVAGPLRVALADHPGFTAVQAVPGVGPVSRRSSSPRSVTSPGSPRRRI